MLSWKFKQRATLNSRIREVAHTTGQLKEAGRTTTKFVIADANHGNSKSDFTRKQMLFDLEKAFFGIIIEESRVLMLTNYLGGRHFALELINYFH